MKNKNKSTKRSKLQTLQGLWHTACISLCLVILAVSCTFGQGEVLFKDNFKNKSLDGWTTIDVGDSKPKSEWVMGGNRLVQLANTAATNDYPFPPASVKIPTLEITGRVFEDRNANGRQDAGEKGLSGVRVSDGYTIVRTAKDGSYRISSVDRKRSKFVFMIVPSGRRASSSYYSALPDEGEQYQSDFALTASSESAKRSFSFAQISDIHVVGDAGPLVEDLAEIAVFKPSFIVATGDLVNDGRRMSQLETYMAGIQKSAVPVINLPGNHDGGGDPINYEDIFGPDYYSFDYGGCHFVMFNSADTSEAQQHWLKMDLEEAKGAPVLFFQHYHPSSELMKTLAQHNTIGVFTGHWHTTKVFQYSNGRKSSTLYVNTPPLLMGGIDVSPRGFVLARVNNGKLSLDHRYGGVKQKTAIACPADGSKVAAGDVDIRVVAYDSSSPQVRVDYRVDDGPWKQAKQSGRMTWAARERLSDGEHKITARYILGNNEPIEKQTHFTVSSDLIAAPKIGDNWPMLRHDAARTGVSGDTVAPPLRLAWSNCLGGTAHGASPVVVGDTVYVGIADEDCRGRAGVYALDLKSGAIRWSYHTNGSIRNSVAVDNDTVYAVSVAGEVVALDAASGDVRFKHSMNGVDRWLFSSPVVKDGVLYAGSGAELLALDARTGDEIWKTDGMGGDWISCLTSPAVGSGWVYMGLNWSNGLFALNRRTGKTAWNNKKGYGTTHGTPTVVDGRVYHAADNRLHCDNASDGSSIWKFDLPGGWTLSSPVVSDNKVFVGGPDGRMYCVDASSGKPIWSTPTGNQILCFTPYGRDGNPFVASPVVSGKTVYCGSGDGKLYAYSADDGKVLWSYDVGVPITASPAISGNSVFITTFDGMVCAFTEERSRE